MNAMVSEFRNAGVCVSRVIKSRYEDKARTNGLKMKRKRIEKEWSAAEEINFNNYDARAIAAAAADPAPEFETAGGVSSRGIN